MSAGTEHDPADLRPTGEPVEAARPAAAVPTGHGHGHGHGVSADADRKLLSGALALILVFMAAEVVVGFAAGRSR